MAKPILIVKIPFDLDEKIDLKKWFEGIEEDYYVIVIYSKSVNEFVFEYPKNCDLPESELDKIKGVILVK